MKYVNVKRHSKFVRSCHWGIVISGIFMGLTGMQLAGLINPIFDDAFALHIRLGFIFGALWALFIYFSLREEWKWLNPGRIPYSTKFVIEEAIAWIKGDHVDDPRAYDPKRREYVEKVIPSQVLVWWTYLILTILIGLTGLALYYTNFFAPLISFAGKIGTIFGCKNGYIFIRALHRFIMFLFAVVMFLHAYAATIFGTLASMITGIRRERVAEESISVGSR